MSFYKRNGSGYDSYFGFAHEGNGGSPFSFSSKKLAQSVMFLTTRKHTVYVVANCFFLYGRLFYENRVSFELKMENYSTQKRR
jgi:hypothetical protein